MTELLASLHTIDWAAHEHAYGPATDTPEHLRSFATGDADARAGAASALAASLCHQGTLYPPTPLAVPFLWELVSAPAVADKHLVLALLADIATLDDDRRFLLGGLREPSRWPKKLGVEARAFIAVRDGGDHAIAALADADPRTRAAAAHLLAWLSALAERSAPALAAALDAEREPSARAALLLALGFVAGYLERRDHDARLERDLADPRAIVSGAAALALATARAGEVDEAVLDRIGALAASGPEVATKDLRFAGGDLAAFAAPVLAATADGSPGGAARLLALMARGREEHARLAANVLVRRLFDEVPPPPSPKRPGTPHRRTALEDEALAAVALRPDALAGSARAFVEHLAARPELWDHDLWSACRARGLPAGRELVARWLGRPVPASRIERVVAHAGRTAPVADHLIALAALADAALGEAAAALVATLGAEDALLDAFEASLELDGGEVHRVFEPLVARAAPGARAALATLAARFEREGAPRRPDVFGNATVFSNVFPLLGVGLAHAALAAGEEAAPEVDALLQQRYGFSPTVRDALAALPPARRERWLLDPKRDDRAQPAEHFAGAWDYWAPYPSAAVTERVLAHVAVWKAKDPWGGRRAQHAEPRLTAYVASLRAAGLEADAQRCEAALAKARAEGKSRSK